MGIAALILGIVSILVGFIPFCGFFAIIPAIVGLILGIVDVVKKNKPDAENKKKGVSIAGIILSTIAIVFIILWNVFFAALIYTAAEDSINDYNDYYESTGFNMIDTNYNYDDFNDDFEW